MTPIDPFDPVTLVPPVCQATVKRLQGILDGELPADALDADPHPAACAACRERVAAARLMISVLGLATEPAPIPSGLTERILDAVQADHAERRVRTRRRVFAFTGGLAIAAAVVIAVYLNWPTKTQPNNPAPPPDLANSHPSGTPEIAPEPHEAPQPRIRIGDELEKASLALREAPKTITEPAIAAPRLIAKVGDALSFPAPVPEMDPPRAALADIPDAARTGLEPVTNTAQKAFARLLHDVGGMKPKS